MITKEELKQMRTEKGLSLRALAELIGVSAPFLHDVERGSRRLSEKREKQILAVLRKETE